MIHPPSIYDFRFKDIRSGPISDVIPSTPVFEMYPIGFVSMLNYLISNGFNARISNLAVLMLHSAKFNVEKYISRLDSDLFGISLHWLPHVHGAINIARIIKKEHPDSKIVLGGFSSSYFKEEIMHNYPEIDFILSGDLQEKNTADLADVVQGHGRLEDIPSLSYRGDNAGIKFNPVRWNSGDIDRVFLNYEVLMKNSLKYHDIIAHTPYAGWLNNPQGFTVIEHGCSLNCGFCGGSNFAFRGQYGYASPLIRKPERVAEEIELIQEVLGAPFFIAGDLNNLGEAYYETFFSEIKQRGIDLPILTEYFIPPNEKFIASLSKTLPDFAMEMSPESMDEKIRGANRSLYSNLELEKSLEIAKSHGCKKFDLYFSIGLREQKSDDVISTVRSAGQILEKYNRDGMSTDCFISPISPFVDPGSLWFEQSERQGFIITARKLSDFYDILDRGRSWEDYLNYHTIWMSKKEIIDSTYEAEIEMTRIRQKAGIISTDRAEHIISNVTNYLQGGVGYHSRGRESHLTYMKKDIEWSRKHQLSPYSFLIFLYSKYNALRKDIGGGREK